MVLLLLKLFVAPLLIGGASVAGRRRGPSVAGVLAALPVTTGSVSFFVALEQGPDFCAETASAAMIGLGAAGLFCLAYAHASGRFGWPVSLAIGYVSFGVSSFAIVILAGWPVIADLGVVVATLAMVLRLTPPTPAGERLKPPAWDIPARMITATACVVAVTALAADLGPEWSGCLAAFPVIFGVLLVFTHRHEGRPAALGVIRGFLAGLVATSLFLAIVVDGIGPLGIGWSFALAAAACLMYQAAAMWFMQHHGGHAASEAALAGGRPSVQTPSP